MTAVLPRREHTGTERRPCDDGDRDWSVAAVPKNDQKLEEAKIMPQGCSSISGKEGARVGSGMSVRKHRAGRRVSRVEDADTGPSPQSFAIQLRCNILAIVIGT